MARRKPHTNDPNIEANILNRETYVDYYQRMSKIALSMFEWINLPDSMNARYIEQCLFFNGQAAFLYDAALGFINTNAAGSSAINIYGVPSQTRCWSYGFERVRKTYVGQNSRMRKSDEAILVMNNWERVPTYASLDLFAKRLSDAQRTIDINLNAQKTPILVETSDEQRLTALNTYAQYAGNAPVIIGNKDSFNNSGMTVHKTDAPYIVDKVMDYKQQIFNEFLSFIGVMNLDEKKERRVVNESEANNEFINLNLQSFLAPRKQACKEFNAKYGENIDVKVRSDIHNIVKEQESIFSGSEKEGSKD